MKQVLYSDQELAAMANFIDAGIRQLGAAKIHEASHLLQKLENAEEVEPPKEVKPSKPEAVKK